MGTHSHTSSLCFTSNLREWQTLCTRLQFNTCAMWIVVHTIAVYRESRTSLVYDKKICVLSLGFFLIVFGFELLSYVNRWKGHTAAGYLWTTRMFELKLFHLFCIFQLNSFKYNEMMKYFIETYISPIKCSHVNIFLRFHALFTIIKSVN